MTARVRCAVYTRKSSEEGLEQSFNSLRANDWVDRILRGEVSNQRALARETGVDERYISRIIPLAFLAPDITETILEGRQTASLSLEKCAAEIPLEWTRQRATVASSRFKDATIG